MRLALLALPLLSILASACTLDPTSDGLKVHPRIPYTSNAQTISEESWNGEPIFVQVEHGNVQVVGKRDAKRITVRANAYTWADDADDAREMTAAVLAKVNVRRENGSFVVRCAKPDGDVKSALANASQCNVRVEVPAPDGVVHDVQAYAVDGFTYLNRLATDSRTQIRATGIEVEGILLRGNVDVHAEWLDVEVEPIGGGTVSVESTTDDWYFIPSLQEVPKRDERDGGARFGATLRLPKDFRSQRVELASQGASVEAFAFPDVANGQPRGPIDATAAAFVSVKANQGNATLLAREDNMNGARSDDFGTDARDPWH